jgi:hypothetical protein
MTLQSQNKPNNRKPPYKAVFSCPKECAEKINRYFCEHLPAHTEEVADVEALADFLSCIIISSTSFSRYRESSWNW